MIVKISVTGEVVIKFNKEVDMPKIIDKNILELSIMD